MNFSINKGYKETTIYKYNFANLTDLYNYLKSEPKVNTNIFKKQISIIGEESFGGENLKTAIEYLRGGYKLDLDRFNIAVNELNKIKIGEFDDNSDSLEHCIHGGIYLSPLVAAGVPDCMVRYTKDMEPKRITIYFQLAYSVKTRQQQVFNRGIVTINLIQALEEKGYLVDLKVFELLKMGNEFLDITVNLKNIDEHLNVSRCYYPFVSKEFLRRLLFRVLESAPVKNCWDKGYGEVAHEDEIREYYKLRENDLVIAAPSELEILGENIYEDTFNLFKTLNLQDGFDLSSLEQKVKKKHRKKYR